MDMDTAKDVLSNLKLPFLGFHVFQWNNILSLERLRNIWTDTIDACKKLTTDFKVLDVGGGLGIPYAGQEPLEWNSVNAVIGELKDEHNISEFWLEMGRYLTGPYGKYITKVVDVKRTYEKDILVLEGGINHLARPALVNEFFPVELLRKSPNPEKLFSLHGPLCTSLDFLGEHLLPDDVSVGDIIVFKQTGAYGFTESMPFFLCHKLPGEAIIEQGYLLIIREPQSANIWLK
jgi:diaminopimelate decarboxylase